MPRIDLSGCDSSQIGKFQSKSNQSSLVVMTNVQFFILVVLVTFVISTQRVLLVSLDGFRHDYSEKFGSKFNFPNIKRLIQTGSRAERFIPVFPSDTFPAHYAVITGLHSESHGIVGNQFLDPQFDNAVFTISNAESKNSRWWHGEPLWVTAVLQNKISGCVFWPGSEVDIKGVRPTYWHRFNDSITAENRVNMVFEFLDKPENQRPHFMTLYFSDVDHAGHSYGPDDDHVGEMIEHVDKALGHLVKGIQSRGEKIDIIMVSDHGMIGLSPDRRVFLDDYIKDEIPHLKFHNFGTIYPNGGPNNQRHVTLQPENQHYQDLIVKKLKGAHPQLDVYIKTDPQWERFHFKKHRRIGNVVLLTKPGWNIALRTLGGTGTVGGHGFDNMVPEMQGIFIANGPSFKQGQKMPPVSAVNVYSLVAKILNLKEAPNNGTWNAFSPILK
jgi:predicted AlkP superfamily pyrophosphatase or phosphodiesterase